MSDEDLKTVVEFMEEVGEANRFALIPTLVANRDVYDILKTEAVKQEIDLRDALA